MKNKQKKNKNKPEIGDYIIHREPSFNRVNEGEITQILAMQFTYLTPDGQDRFCLFSEDWNHKQKERD
jgi:hypothetical protein|tara:strand:+ start:1656 stop:1859 length:204 start_codon:yes stop_codon:yes gene_type:complete